MLLTRLSYTVFVARQNYQRGIFSMVLKRSLHCQWVGYSKLVHQKQLRRALHFVFTFV